MSKYDLLWKQIDLLFRKTNKEKITISFAELEKLGGITIDHSFLTHKMDLESYGYKVDKISLKQKQISFCKK